MKSPYAKFLVKDPTEEISAFLGRDFFGFDKQTIADMETMMGMVMNRMDEVEKVSIETANRINQSMQEVLNHIVAIAEEVRARKGDPGEPGKSVTVEELIPVIQSLIPPPVPGKNAEITPDLIHMLAIEASKLVPPHEIRTIERIIEKPVIQEKGIDDIKGLREALKSNKDQRGGYVHGGGDTIAAGSNITITDVNGRKVISSTGGASITSVYGEVVSFTGTSGTLAHTPVGSIALYRGNVRLFQTDDYTNAGAAITLIVGAASGEKFICDYSY